MHKQNSEPFKFIPKFTYVFCLCVYLRTYLCVYLPAAPYDVQLQSIYIITFSTSVIKL